MWFEVPLPFFLRDAVYGLGWERVAVGAMLAVRFFGFVCGGGGGCPGLGAGGMGNVTPEDGCGGKGVGCFLPAGTMPYTQQLRVVCMGVTQQAAAMWAWSEGPTPA